MATILNPTPVKASIFGGVWVRELTIHFPSPESAGMLSAVLFPTDGEHLLATGQASIRQSALASKVASDPRLALLLSSLRAELNRQLGSDAEWRVLRVVAPAPTLPVVAIATAGKGSDVRIMDCFAKAAEDQIFAAVFLQALGIVASLVGLEIG